MRLPRPCELVGKLAIGDTQLTMFGGSMPEVMKTIMKTAHEKGADVVDSDFRQDHRISKAPIIAWKPNCCVTPTLGKRTACRKMIFWPISSSTGRPWIPSKGIWSDGSPDRIGIMRNTSKPGRDFIAFMLNVELPSWQVGYKKMDIARTDRPGAYSLKYYRDDFGMVKTTVLLDHEPRVQLYDHHRRQGGRGHLHKNRHTDAAQLKCLPTNIKNSASAR